MDNIVYLLAGIASLVFGVHTVITRRVTFGENEDDLQVWLYGWRAVVIGCIALVLAVIFFLSAAGFIHIDRH